MILYSEIGLIGDTLGYFPAMIELSNTVDMLYVVPHPEIYELFDMIPKKYDISRHIPENYQDENTKKLDLQLAFSLAIQNNLHMIQSHYYFVGLPIPSNIPKPELDVPDIKVPVYDYIISPFSRSLPNEQLWQKEKWLELVNKLSNKSFAIFGNSKYDDVKYLEAPNVIVEFGRPFVEVANIMKKAKHGLLSVVTGTSHLAYALDVKNYLLENQSQSMKWGINPSSLRITQQVDTISVDSVIDLLKY